MAAHGAPVWEVPAGELASQRLYRVSYSGPEGEGSFRITLRLASLERYAIQAADPVGRELWSLDVAGERGLFLNHRASTACVFAGSFDLSGVPLGAFPLPTLPALLLGRVPARPAGSPEQHGREVRFHDDKERVWTAQVSGDGVVESWTAAHGGAPAVWWMRRDNWAILSDRERGVQVRWREVLREPLRSEPAPLKSPSGYREESCREPTLPIAPGG